MLGRRSYKASAQRTPDDTARKKLLICLRFRRLSVHALPLLVGQNNARAHPGGLRHALMRTICPASPDVYQVASVEALLDAVPRGVSLT